MARPFDKLPTTYQQQIALLRSRGMIVENDARAAFHLRHLNYYRLSAYTLPFEVDQQVRRFDTSARFEDVLELYRFDRELRLLLLDSIERVEVSIRSQWAYQMAHTHGPHAHVDGSLAKNSGIWRRDLKRLMNEVHRSDEVFIRPMRTAYTDPLPPVWAACEVMSLGLFSSLYANLRPKATRRLIAEEYALDEGVLESWLHHLTYVRNVCAHHARLWNRDLKITPAHPRTKPAGLGEQFARGSRRLHNTLVILLYLMDVISPGHDWRLRLIVHLSSLPAALREMDFPPGWAALEVWR